MLCSKKAAGHVMKAPEALKWIGRIKVVIMPNCCSDELNKREHLTKACPFCVQKGQSVSLEIVQHLVRKDIGAALRDGGYSLCKTKTCPVVYYHAESGQAFTKKEVLVRVGFKETEGPVWLCYCFDISKQMIQKKSGETGKSFFSEWILEEIRAHHCDCKIKNPSGRCCLANVRAAEKAIKSTAR